MYYLQIQQENNKVDFLSTGTKYSVSKNKDGLLLLLKEKLVNRNIRFSVPHPLYKIIGISEYVKFVYPFQQGIFTHVLHFILKAILSVNTTKVKEPRLGLETISYSLYPILTCCLRVNRLPKYLLPRLHKLTHTNIFGIVQSLAVA